MPLVSSPHIYSYSATIQLLQLIIRTHINPIELIIKMLKRSSVLAWFFLLSSQAYAATDQTDLELNYTYTPYVKFVGTAVGASRQYDNDDIANWIFPSVVNLGTLGLESNIGGSCDINFSTLNNFDLLHTVSGSSLTKYKILYQAQEFSLDNNPTLSMPCTSIPTDINFEPTQIVFGNLWPELLIESGIYRDVVTVVVTTQ